MFENITYAQILQRMLNSIPNPVDKREGSIIYDAIAPAAFEMKEMYINLDTIINETFADSASRETLMRRAAERGLEPKIATYAIVKGIFNINIPINSRFSLNDLNYTVIELLEGKIYKLKCETVGAIGNDNFGSLVPIDYIDGLESAELTEVLVPGENEEATEDFRKRYFNSFESQAFAGNIADYKEKTNAIDGVGGVKVLPIWNGGGTVKLIVIDSAFNKPSTELIQSVQKDIDPTSRSGIGIGFAPIGHIVTVESVADVLINVKSKITFAPGYNFDNSKISLMNAINSYLLSLKKTWEDSEYLIIRLSGIEYALLGCKEVLDIEGTLINDGTKNISLKSNEIPKGGDIVAII